MIDFELTEDHVSIRNTVREWAQREVAPQIKEWDEKQQFNRSVLDKMAELGLHGVCIPDSATVSMHCASATESTTPGASCMALCSMPASWRTSIWQ